ncbi:MoaD/ThiS family protein [Aquimarina sp. ERC-38]|uniref:MoaD/ThiS family protein n=1 Tax=Aquimarina sp. ERC-38 TaxID=2949996 RepID=UPI0022478303|nr:MoaD/ThiS family protein [Aquimarina sp. ERC-38]UZO79252.1 MoaD/ThiS family protein [Aquimarina sp. ERC-38]
MEITVKYLGMIAEATGCTSEVIATDQTKVTSFLEELYKKYPDLKNMEFKVAQQQELVEVSATITGAEIALLPPFSGG